MTTSHFPHRFDGRVALVTGAARGIGYGAARRLAAEGASVVLADLEAEAVERAAAQLRAETGNERIRSEALDIGRSDAVNKTVARVEKEFGPIDALVNNAGILRDNWVDRLTDEDWDAVLRVNLTGAFYCARAVIPAMKKRGYGRIVSLSSRAWMGNPGQANYSASKAGIVGLTRALALELVRFGITVNAVAPGLIDTPMAQGLTPEVRERLIQAQPGGRMGTVDEVAALIAFLASPEASFVTGQVISACGGKSLGMGGVA